MKVKVIAEAGAWYKHRRLQQDDVIDFLEDKLPSWAVPVEPKKGRTVTIEPVIQENNQNDDEPFENDNQPSVNAYSEISYQDLKKICKERNIQVKSQSRNDIENALIAADVKLEKYEAEDDFESMEVAEITALAEKNFGCKLNTNEPKEMVIKAYRNAEKVFPKKKD